MTHASKPVEQVIAAIQALDLDPIKLKLMDPEEGQGWSREYVERMESAYKRFLILMVKFPADTIAPTKDVDKFWHGHILDTMKYAEDCQNVFGYFLHHFPYFGMRGEQDAADLQAASARMHELHQREFGEPMASQAAFCAAAKPAAFCAAGKPEAAFCAAAKLATAFCAAAKPKAAFCAAAKPGTAFCAAANPGFCAAAKPTASFCAAAVPGLKANVRPTLPARI
ncbi:MAG: glycine-rich domain-containing protein [Betaproteobacteria bacterium]